MAVKHVRAQNAGRMSQSLIETKLVSGQKVQRERERERERVNDQNYCLSFITAGVTLQENNMDGITVNTLY